MIEKVEKYNQKFEKLNKSLQLPSPIPENIGKTTFFQPKKQEAEK